jgi:hypothetical protein
VPQGIGNRSAIPPVRESKLCFSYPADVPLGNRNRGAQPTSPEVRSMPYPCFRY